MRSTAERGVQKVPVGAFGGRGASVRRFAEVASQGLPDAYRSWVSYVKEPEWQALTAQGGADTWALADYQALWDSSRGAHPLHRLLDLNNRTYLPDDLLVKVDRMS